MRALMQDSWPGPAIPVKILPFRRRQVIFTSEDEEADQWAERMERAWD